MKKATLVLKDGTTLTGESFGADITSAGEVVFNTSMVGYPESFTDPSYTGQIMVLTYPLVGNYGVPDKTHDDQNIEEFFESNNVHIKGLVVSEYSDNFNHWNGKKSLGDWLKEKGIPAITGIDTRALTEKIRQHGTLLGQIVPEGQEKENFYDPDKDNLVDQVSPKEVKIYNKEKGKKTIVAIDCGMKNNILRNLIKRDLTVIRVPWDYDFIEAGLEFDGIFMSNGPGDPSMLKPLHKIVKKAFDIKKPIFGICLGCQIMALAAGAKTYKLKFGHRSQNQPCMEVGTHHCYITSQNHGFAIKESSLPKDWEIWLKNANDDTVEGIKHKTLPFFSCQFHPEAMPGPTDTQHFFDKFVEML